MALTGLSRCVVSPCERQPAVALMRESACDSLGKRRGGRRGASRGESLGCCVSLAPSCGWGSWEVPDVTQRPCSACPVCGTTRRHPPPSLRPTFAGTFDMGPLSNFIRYMTRLSTYGALDADRGARSPLTRMPLVLTHIPPLSSARYADLATSRWF